MSLHRAIYENLVGDNAITALVGAGAKARIWAAGTAKQGTTLPWISTQRIATDHGNILSGASALAGAIVQINCVANTYDGARALSELVRARMRRTAWMGTTVGTITIEGVRHIGDDDGVESPVPGATRGVYFTQDDYGIMHREAVPA